MQSWRAMRDLLEAVGRPGVVGYQADMAHSMLYTLGYNAEADRILPEDYDWKDTAALDAAYQQGRRCAPALDARLPRRAERRHRLRLRRPREDRPPLPVDDPNGRLDVVKHAGYWLRDENGNLTKTMRHICWDGCMFPNAVMEEQDDLEQGSRRPWSRCATRTAGAE